MRKPRPLEHIWIDGSCRVIVAESLILRFEFAVLPRDFRLAMHALQTSGVA